MRASGVIATTIAAKRIDGVGAFGLNRTGAHEPCRCVVPGLWAVDGLGDYPPRVLIFPTVGELKRSCGALAATAGCRDGWTVT